MECGQEVGRPVVDMLDVLEVLVSFKAEWKGRSGLWYPHAQLSSLEV